MELITIKSEQLTALVSPIGAEIHSVKNTAGKEFIWEGDPAVWGSHTPILFPVAGALRDNCYELDGVRYPMNKHGFARNVPFQVEKTGENFVTLLYNEKQEGFPFEYDFRITYTVEANQIKVAFDVSSRDERPFYFSVGSHEAYCTPEGFENYELHFDEEETLIHSLLEGPLNNHETQLIAENTKVLPLKNEYFTIDALIFRSLKSRGVALKGCGRKSHVSYPDHPVLLIWTKPGAKLVCIEPWCNGPDFTDADHRIDHKFGFLRLEKGQTINRTHVITFD